MPEQDPKVVRSTQNPLIQRVRAAFSGKAPELIVLQGDRLVDDAITARVGVEVVLVAHDRPDRAREIANRRVDVRLVDATVLARVGTLQKSPGILALAPTPPTFDLATFELDRDAVVLVVAGIADPGNLGALARASEAFGAAAFVVVAGGASPWNEKALRGSMGSLLRVPVVMGSDAETIAAVLARRSVRCVRAGRRRVAVEREGAARIDGQSAACAGRHGIRRRDDRGGARQTLGALRPRSDARRHGSARVLGGRPDRAVDQRRDRRLAHGRGAVRRADDPDARGAGVAERDGGRVDPLVRARAGSCRSKPLEWSITRRGSR